MLHYCNVFGLLYSTYKSISYARVFELRPAENLLLFLSLFVFSACFKTPIQIQLQINLTLFSYRML